MKDKELKLIPIEEIDIDDFKTIITVQEKKDLIYLAKKYNKEIFIDLEYLSVGTPSYVYQWKIKEK